jgi:hypothetical protein
MDCLALKVNSNPVSVLSIQASLCCYCLERIFPFFHLVFPSDHKISDIGFITNEYGLPCIEGELITDAAQYLM